jgi:hypothetical protein
MAEENETPGGEPPRAHPPGSGPPGSGRRIEGDLLAERRALRAAESGEAALVRRAEAAEATLQTLERHVQSLQQRLGDAEEERLRLAELLEAERTVAVEREHELRRVKQREYAEQQLRVEAEDRLAGADRGGRAEVERLARRLGEGEAEARELGGRLEVLQRQLAEAEQAAAAERVAARRASGELHARLVELEGRAAEVERGLHAERAARERSERLLAAMREGHGRVEVIVGEMKQIVARLAEAISARAAAPPPAPPPLAPSAPLARPAPQQQPPPSAIAQARGEEMAEALAAAVERLRARAEAAPPAATEVAPPAAVRVPHKHSMSLITRWRIRRKQRRAR